MYWRIGHHLNEEREYGTGFIDSLSKDIRQAFPGIKGMSAATSRRLQLCLFAQKKTPKFASNPMHDRRHNRCNESANRSIRCSETGQITRNRNNEDRHTELRRS